MKRKFVPLLAMVAALVMFTACGSNEPRVCANDSTVTITNDMMFVADVSMTAAGRVYEVVLNPGGSVSTLIPYLHGGWVTVSAAFYNGYPLTLAGIADTYFYMGTETCGGVTVVVRTSALQWRW